MSLRGKSMRTSCRKGATGQWWGALRHNSTSYLGLRRARFQVRRARRVDRGMSRVGFVDLPSTGAFWCALILASSVDLLLFLRRLGDQSGSGSWTCLLFVCFGAH